MRAIYLLAPLVGGLIWADTGGTQGTPTYTGASIANAAANVADFFAPDTFLTIYGTNLAYVTKAISPDDIRAGTLPTALIATGVRVLLNQTPANMYFVSPNQVNILIPTSIRPGVVTLQLVNDSIGGPAISINVGSAAPALFQQPGSNIVIATHGNGPLVTRESPAKRGEIVVLYATGLGATIPAAVPNQIPTGIAPLANLTGFRVLLNNAAVDAKAIQYAGNTPGFAGLFQINLRLPDNAPSSPEIRVGYDGLMSPGGRVLPVE